jgi:hypothetical protein
VSVEELKKDRLYKVKHGETPNWDEIEEVNPSHCSAVKQIHMQF